MFRRLAVCFVLARSAGAQVRALTRDEAIAEAMSRATRAAVASADVVTARASLLAARERPNPTLTPEFTKSAPQYHLTIELPFDFRGLRSARIQSANASLSAALLRFQFERESAAVDADIAYTRALAAQARADLSRRNAIAADSLQRIAMARRDAGDASELDVELASIFAGQQRNAASVDSLDVTSTLLDLQIAIGLRGATVSVAVRDSLGPPPSPGTPSTGPPLLIAAANASAASAAALARAERRSVWLAPAVSIGVETHDPSGDERGILPTIGFSLPIPLFNRHRAAIALADAASARARIELRRAEFESDANIARAMRERDLAAARVIRDQSLIASANRVAAMSLTAYREGAATLASVLEAQRNARDILSSYIDDVAAAWIAVATLRVLTLTASPETPK